MFLSKLELCGFKSFVNKTDLRFKDGLMGVVGPNGCGKSNVVDAIRWVMGEQRPSVLRCNKMEDVVFNGSRGRKSVGMAEVSITIQNTQNLLPVDYNEVTVTRRLYKSGESEYMVNRTPCRLKDIHDIFMDTGMGSQSYSVIEQSMQDALLSDRTESRRLLFDEAAGITKYKTRAGETMRKLSQTTDDLVRINDILLEVQKKTDSLKRQVTRAKRYQEFTGALRKTELYVSRTNLTTLTNELGPLAQETDELTGLQKEWQGSVQTMDAQREGLRAELLSREKSLATSQEHVDAVNRQLQETDRDLVMRKEKRNAANAMIERLETENTGLEEQMETKQADISRMEISLTPLATGLRNLEIGFTEEERNFDDFEYGFQKRKTTLNERRSELWGQMDMFSRESQELQKQSYAHENLEGQLISIRNEREQLAINITNIESSLEALNVRRQEIGTTISGQGSEREAIATQISSHQERIEELRIQEGEIGTHIKSKEFNLDILEKLKSDYEGFNEGVKSLVHNADQIGGIRKVVADVIHTPKEYSYALETVLGNSLQFLISDSLHNAHDAISYLAKNHSGKATLVANDHFNTLDMHIDYTSLLTEPGVIGAAWDLVQPEVKYANIIKYLLRDVLLVDTLDTAFALIELHQENAELRFVTPTGEILQSNGILTGGHSANNAGLIGRDDEILELHQSIIQLSENRERFRNETDIETETMSERQRSLKNIDDLIGQNQRSLTGLEKEIVELQFQEKNLLNRNHRLEEDETKTTENITECDQLIEDLAEKYDSFSREEREEEIKRNDSELQELEQDRDIRSRRLQQWRNGLMNLQSEEKRLTYQITNYQEAVAEASRRIERNAEELLATSTSIAEMDKMVEELSITLETEFASRSAMEKERDNFRSDYETIFGQVDALEKQLREQRHAGQQRQNKLHENAMRQQKIDMDIANITRYISETYQLDITALNLEQLAEDLAERMDTTEVLASQCHELKSKLERLGPVNLLALDEYKTESERLDFLSIQHEDLAESKELLEKTLQKINKTARNQFSETFEKIQENFNYTYGKFFDGGKAKLYLDEGQDPLESDIHIAAQPKGKNLRHISLLSGGERALTAIAMLFAIYLVKPSPFCILDEVDAPLDDANLLRFLDVIQEFSNNTQFLIVTHNKQTMEASDCLYGVTMQEEGVSQLVSVKF